jgi:hypothetical protein
MSTIGFDYNAMVEKAMRDVVRQALARTAEIGMPCNHHMLVGFRTDAPGVVMPGYLRQSYPQEMTIVLQHQFWDLEAGRESFSVTLNFNRIPERLTVPYSAVAAFTDPSVQFGLQFRVKPGEAVRAQVPASPAAVPPAAPPAEPDASEPATPTAAPAQKTGEVVALDAFRK